MSISSSKPAAPPDAAYQGHVLTLNQMSGEVTCQHCALSVQVSIIVGSTAAVPHLPGPCPGTEEGRRLIAEAKAEEAQAPPVTEPCIAVPPDWEGTDAEAIGLAVAGAVADIGRQRDDANRRLENALDVLSSLVASFPETSWAGSNINLEQARELLQLERPTPGDGQ